MPTFYISFIYTYFKLQVLQTSFKYTYFKLHIFTYTYFKLHFTPLNTPTLRYSSFKYTHFKYFVRRKMEEGWKWGRVGGCILDKLLEIHFPGLIFISNQWASPRSTWQLCSAWAYCAGCSRSPRAWWTSRLSWQLSPTGLKMWSWDCSSRSCPAADPRYSRWGKVRRVRSVVQVVRHYALALLTRVGLGAAPLPSVLDVFATRWRGLGGEPAEVLADPGFH